MENNDLSQQDAEKLFKDVSSALVKGESVDTLMEAGVSKDSPPPAEKKETPAEVTPEKPQEPKPEEAKAEEAAKPDAQKAAQEAPQPKEADTPDFTWLESLPDDVKSKVSKLKDELFETRNEAKLYRQQYRSNAGRISAYQRSIANLKTELANRPLAKDLPAAKLETDEDFKALAENDPKFAAFFQKSLEKAMDSYGKATAESVDKRLNNVFGTMFDAQKQDYVMEQRHVLREMVPNLDDVVAAPEFQDWRKYQMDNGNEELLRKLHSDHAAEVVEALQVYSIDLYNYNKARAQKQPVTAANGVVDTKIADQIAESRERKTASAGAKVSSSIASPQANPENFDPVALFNKFYKELHPSKPK